MGSAGPCTSGCRGGSSLLNTIATRWAPVAPALCAVHCALSPALALAVPAIAGPGAERWGFIISAALALAGLAAGVRAHGRALPPALTLAGLLLWGVAVAGALTEAAATAGSLLTAAGMLWSARLVHQVRCPGCESGGVSGASHGRG